MTGCANTMALNSHIMDDERQEQMRERISDAVDLLLESYKDKIKKIVDSYPDITNPISRDNAWEQITEDFLYTEIEFAVENEDEYGDVGEWIQYAKEIVF